MNCWIVPFILICRYMILLLLSENKTFFFFEFYVISISSFSIINYYHYYACYYLSLIYVSSQANTVVNYNERGWKQKGALHDVTLFSPLTTGTNIMMSALMHSSESSVLCGIQVHSVQHYNTVSVSCSQSNCFSHVLALRYFSTHCVHINITFTASIMAITFLITVLKVEDILTTFTRCLCSCFFTCDTHFCRYDFICALSHMLFSIEPS